MWWLKKLKISLAPQRCVKGLSTVPSAFWGKIKSKYLQKTKTVDPNFKNNAIGLGLVWVFWFLPVKKLIQWLLFFLMLHILFNFYRTTSIYDKLRHKITWWLQNTSLQAILHFDRNYLALSLQPLSVSVMKKYSGTYYYTTTFFVLRSFKSHLCVLARRYSPNSLTSPSQWAVKVIFLLLSYQLHCLDVLLYQPLSRLYLILPQLDYLFEEGGDTECVLVS